MKESIRKYDCKNKNKKSRNRILFQISSILCLMLLCGVIGYFASSEEIKGSYNKIVVITNDKEGVGFEELSRSFLPDLDVKLGSKMIKAANGYVSDDITFLKGQRVKIPSKDTMKSWTTDRVIIMNH